MTEDYGLAPGLMLLRLDDKKLQRLKDGVPISIDLRDFPGLTHFIIAYGSEIRPLVLVANNLVMKPRKLKK